MKQLKAILGLLIVASVIYVGWKVFPIYYTNYEFEEYLESQARIESYSQHNESEIADVMAKKAQDLEIPLKSEQIHVTKVGNDLTIWTEYTVHVDLPVHDLDLTFKPATKNKRI